MAKAVQEQQAADAFSSMTQAEQMATSQQARALGLGNATSDLAQIQQKLTTGDIANAQGLFNIGSTAAQLPQTMQGSEHLSGWSVANTSINTSRATSCSAHSGWYVGWSATPLRQATAGKMFGDLASTGLQERLTGESAAAALRGKQYTSALGALANKGGASGTAANKIQQAIDAGIKKVGDELFDAGGKLLGSAVELLGSTTASLWDGIGNIFDTDAQFETDWQAALDGQLTSGDSNLISGTIDSISSGIEAAWDWAKDIFYF
jgi:hypothetical protein